MKDKITLALGNILNSEFTENKNPPIKFGSIPANLDRYYVLFMTFGIESFTSLMVNVRQDIKSVSSFIRCHNGTFPFRDCFVSVLVHGTLTQMRTTELIY